MIPDHLAARLAALILAMGCLVSCSDDPVSEDDVDIVVDVVTDTESDDAAPADVAPADVAPPECQAAKDCKAPAKDSCAVAVCAAGKCVIEAAKDGATCDDGNVCTDPDTCTLGDAGKLTCTGPKVCACEKTGDCADKNDANPCNPDYFCDLKTHTCEIKLSSVVTCSSKSPDPCAVNKCDPKDGKCRYLPDDGKTCDDGLVCSTASSCKDGSCVATKVDPTCQCQTIADCKDDGKPCNGSPYCDVATKMCRVNPASVIKCSSFKDGACVKWTCDDKDGTCKPKLLDPAKIPAKGIPTSAQSNCDTDGTSCSQELCKDGECKHIKFVPPCGCNKTSDCAPHEDGNACNGTLYCEKATGTCRVNAATVVGCPSVHDSPCRRATCDPKDGVCKLKTLKDGAKCHDGSPCTVEAKCSKAKCEMTKGKCYCSKTADCAKHEASIEDRCLGTKLYCDLKIGQCKLNPASAPVCSGAADTECLKNRCVPATGKCAPVPALDGQACEYDGTACTSPDRCSNGACEAGKNHCPCSATKDCAAFEDGDICNGLLYCDKAKADKASWVCKVNLASVKSCPDGADVCAPNTCDPKDGNCKVNKEPDGKPCEADGSKCSQESCKDGVCEVSLNVCQCPLGDDCADFEDGNPCNGTLYCDKTGAKESWACKVNPKTVVKCKLTPGGLCKQEQCDPKNGACKSLPFNEGVTCADNDICTLATACKSGECVQAASAATLDCDDKNACTDDKCEAAKGCVFSVATGKSCDDGNACTTTDACGDKAVCLGGAATVCNDGKVCTADSCDAKQGCVFKASVGKACDDGNACTSASACLATGQCGGGTLKTCSDTNPCTTDSCDAKTGCVFAPNAIACDDGDACTDKDACKAGACSGGAITCADKGACKGTCDKLKGCQYTSSAEVCDGKDNDCDGVADNGCDVDQDGHCTDGMQVLKGALCTKTLLAGASGCAALPIDGDYTPKGPSGTVTLGADGKSGDRALAFWHPKRAEIWQVRHVGPGATRAEAVVHRYAPTGALLGNFSTAAPGKSIRAVCGDRKTGDWYVSHALAGVIRTKGLSGVGVWAAHAEKAGKKVQVGGVAAGSSSIYAASAAANDSTIFRLSPLTGKTSSSFNLKRPGTDRSVLAMSHAFGHFFVQHNDPENTSSTTVLRRYDLLGKAVKSTFRLPVQTALPVLEIERSLCVNKTGFGVHSCFHATTPLCNNGDDCDDKKSSLAPSVKEACDGLDNDCDGIVDEWCDVDKDGHCAAGLVVTKDGPCAKDVATGSGRDCLDGNSGARIGAKERCDGLDNNCNGNTDEGCDTDGDGHCDNTLGLDDTAQCAGSLGSRSHCPGVLNDGDVHVTHELKLQPSTPLTGQLRGGYHGFFREYWVGQLVSKAPTVLRRFDEGGREIGTKSLAIPAVTGLVGHALIGDFFVASMQQGAQRIDAKGQVLWKKLNSARAIAIESGTVWVAIGTNSRIQMLHHANGSKTGEFDLLPANKVDVMVPVSGRLFSVLNNAKVLSRHRQSSKVLRWTLPLAVQPSLSLFDGRYLCLSKDSLTLKCRNVLRPACLKGDDCNDNKSDLSPSTKEWCDGLDNDCDKHKDEGCDDDGDGFCDLSLGVAKGATCANTLGVKARCEGVEGRIDTYPLSKQPYLAPAGDDLRNTNLTGGGHPFREEIWLVREPSAGQFGVQRLEPQPGTDHKLLALGGFPLTGQPRPNALAGALKVDQWYSCHDLTGAKKSLTKYQGASTKVLGVLGTTDDCVAMYFDGQHVYRVGKQAQHVVFKWTTDQIHSFKAAGVVQLKGVQSASYIGVAGGRLVVGDVKAKLHKVFNLKAQLAAQSVLNTAQSWHFFAAPWVWNKSTKTVHDIDLLSFFKGDCAKAGDDCNDSDKAVHPGGETVCDGKDDDCDGRIDEGCDRDGDGLCAAGMAVSAQGGPCSKNAAGGKGTDCVPGDPKLPKATETVCDGVDDDCDGTVDDGCDDDNDGHCDKKMDLAAGATCKGTLGDASGCAYIARVSTVLADPAKNGVVSAAAGTPMHQSAGGGHPFRDEIWLVRPHAKSQGPYHVERYDSVLGNDHTLSPLGAFPLIGLGHPNGLAGDAARDAWFRCHASESGHAVSRHIGTSAVVEAAIKVGGDCHAIFVDKSTVYVMTTDKPGVIQGFNSATFAPVLIRQLQGANTTVQFIGRTGPYYLAGSATTEAIYSAVTGKLVGKAKAGIGAKRAFYAAPYVWTPKTGVTWTLRNLWPGLVAEPLCKAGDDCNDKAKGVRPPFERQCDGLDSDCDGTADEGCDRDGDGRCRLGAVVSAKGPCTVDVQKGLSTGSDCGDGDKLVPLDSEKVCDGQDDDCNNKVDEGCDDDADGFCDKGLKVVAGATCGNTFKDLLGRCPLVQTKAGAAARVAPDVAAVALKQGGMYHHGFRREWWGLEESSTKRGTIFRFKDDAKLGYLGSFRVRQAISLPIAGDDRTDSVYAVLDGAVVRGNGLMKSVVWTSPDVGAGVGLAVDGDKVWTGYSASKDPFMLVALRRDSGQKATTVRVADVDGAAKVHLAVQMFTVVSDVIYAKTKGTSTGPVAAFSRNGAWLRDVLDYKRTTHVHMFRAGKRLCIQQASFAGGVGNALKPWCYPLFAAACTTGDDCNDGNSAIKPGATEGCATKDINCDGVTGGACEDGSICTVGDSCQGTTCKAGSSCNDDEVCTADSCDNKLGCVFKPLFAKSCDDGNPCTKLTSCNQGRCMGGTKVNDGAVCDDGDPCTKTSHCNDKVCRPKVGDTGFVATTVGTGVRGSADGSISDATIDGPETLAFDAAGRLWFGTSDGKIRRVDEDGEVRTIVGAAGKGDLDGPRSFAKIQPLTALAAGRDGHIYFADGRLFIRRLRTNTDIVERIAGKGTPGSTDGPQGVGAFTDVQSMVQRNDGTWLLADAANHTIRTLDAHGNLGTFAGAGSPGNNNGFGTQARFTGPGDLALSPDGSLLYVRDASNTGSIRQVRMSNKKVTTLQKGILHTPGLAVDSEGAIYFFGGNVHIARRRSQFNVVAITASAKGFQDGPALVAKFSSPRKMAFDATGKLFFSEPGLHRIRALDMQDAFCRIGSTCFKPGDRNPAQPCEVCQPDKARKAWTLADDGLGCGGANVCQEGGACGCPIGQRDSAGLCLPCSCGAGAVLANNVGSYRFQVLRAAVAQGNENFGGAIAVQGDTMLVGAQSANSVRGEVHVFGRHPINGWVRRSKLNGPVAQGSFGNALALHGNLAVVGAISAEPDKIPAQGAAHIMRHKDGKWTVTATLKAADAKITDSFGSAVATDGKIAAVGALLAEKTGAVYLYSDASGSWKQVNKIRPTSLKQNDTFGGARSLAMSDGWLFAGAPQHDTKGSNAGVLFAFTHALGQVKLQQTLYPTATFSGGYGVVAVDRDRLVVGAPAEFLSGKKRGAVYLYRQAPNLSSAQPWQLVTKLQPPGLGADALFGHAVAIVGGALVVGAPGETLGTVAKAGVAHLYRLQANQTWSLQRRVDSGDAPPGAHQFGFHVATTGAETFIGAPHDSAVKSKSGAVDVFSGGGLCQPDGVCVCRPGWHGARCEQHVCGPNRDCDDGNACTVDSCAGGDSCKHAPAAAGTSCDDGNACTTNVCDGSPSGAACKVKANTTNGGACDDGEPCTLSDTCQLGLCKAGKAAADASKCGQTGSCQKGACRCPNPGASLVGGVCLDCNCSQGAKADINNLQRDLISTTGGGAVAAYDRSPHAIDAEGDRMVIGTANYSPSVISVGQVRVFKRNPLTGRMVADGKTLHSPLQAKSAQFGVAVAISGDTLAATLRGDQSVLVYQQHADGNWHPQVVLRSPGPKSNNTFGVTLALCGDRLFVGHSHAQPAVSLKGEVWLFERSGTRWTRGAPIAPADAAKLDRLADIGGLDCEGDLVAMGSAHHNNGAGAVWLRRYKDGQWQTEAKLGPPAGFLNSGFGRVALSGHRLLVGAYLYKSQKGAALLYERKAGTWKHVQTMIPKGAPNGSQYGAAVALAADLALISGPGSPRAAKTQAGMVELWTESGGQFSFSSTLLSKTAIATLRFGERVAFAGKDMAIVKGGGAHKAEMSVFRARTSCSATGQCICLPTWTGSRCEIQK